MCVCVRVCACVCTRVYIFWIYVEVAPVLVDDRVSFAKEPTQLGFFSTHDGIFAFALVITHLNHS